MRPPPPPNVGLSVLAVVTLLVTAWQVGGGCGQVYLDGIVPSGGASQGSVTVAMDSSSRVDASSATDASPPADAASPTERPWTLAPVTPSSTPVTARVPICYRARATAATATLPAVRRWPASLEAASARRGGASARTGAPTGPGPRELRPVW